MDVSVRHPHATGRVKSAARKNGVAAESATKDKLDTYKELRKHEACTLTPSPRFGCFGVETFGRLSSGAIYTTNKVLMHAFIQNNLEKPLWHAHRWRRHFHQGLSMRLAKSIASGLRQQRINILTARPSQDPHSDVGFVGNICDMRDPS